MKRAWLLLMLCSCASYSSVAQTYQTSGHYELAALYWRAAHLDDPGNAEYVAKLAACVRDGQRSVEHDMDARVQGQDYTGALGAMWRRASLLQDGGGRVDDQAWAAQQQTLEKQALGVAVRRVDTLEGSNASPAQQLDALRVAQGFSPDDGEVARRYGRLKDKLSLNVAVRPGCTQMGCQAFVSHLTSQLLGGRSELVRLVPNGSAIQNADMTIDVASNYSPGEWAMTGTAQTEGRIERRNRFNEVEYDAQGHALTQKVTAEYRTFERVSRGNMAVTVLVRDASPERKVLFQTSLSEAALDARRYVDWQGDERALGNLASLGTDQEPPVDPYMLLTRVATTLAERVSQALLTQLDGT